MKAASLVSAVIQGLRIMLARTAVVAHVRNARLFPGLWIDPSVAHQIAGQLEYQDGCSIGMGANLIVPAGAMLRLGHSSYVGRHVELAPLGTIEIGDHSSIQDRCVLVGDVRIGRYCLLSLNVLMTSGRHHFDRDPHLLIRDQDAGIESSSGTESRPIDIGEDCWIGMNAVIMPGVRIGRGCIIGSNTVVTRDIEPYSVIVGAPARVVRRRLAFAPPPHVDWQDEHHLPYFYTGFEVSQRERERNRPLGGHRAARNFSLWLGGGTSCRVRMRAVQQGVDVRCRGSQHSIGSDWTELTLHRDDAGRPLDVEVAGGAVVISEAWSQ